MPHQSKLQSHKILHIYLTLNQYIFTDRLISVEIALNFLTYRISQRCLVKPRKDRFTTEADKKCFRDERIYNLDTTYMKSWTVCFVVLTTVWSKESQWLGGHSNVFRILQIHLVNHDILALPYRRYMLKVLVVTALFLYLLGIAQYSYLLYMLYIRLLCITVCICKHSGCACGAP